MSNWKRNTAIAALLGAAAVLPAGAAEGRTPIWAPVVVTSPGKYIVTRNISAAAAPIIEIASDNVDIDLNGMTLESAGAGGFVIVSSGFGNLSIRNGRIRGGDEGIHVDSGSNLVIEDVMVTDGNSVGIRVEAFTEFALRRNHVTNYPDIGIFAGVGPGGDPATGILEQNVVEKCGTGIVAELVSATTLRHNRVRTAFNAAGIAVTNGLGVLLENNMTENTVGDGILLNGSRGCKLYNNTASQAGQAGIHLANTDDCLLLDNVVTLNREDGLLIEGRQNHIEANTTNGNGTAGIGFGLNIQGFDNVYRRNVGRGNAGGACPGGAPVTPDICDQPATSSSGGDNFMPFLL